MRLVSFLVPGSPSSLAPSRPAIGLRCGEEVMDLSTIWPEAAGDMAAMLAQGDAAIAEAALGLLPRRPLITLRMAPVVPRPGKVICIGLNYAAHAREGGNPVPDYPAVFLRAASSLCAHGEALHRPAASPFLDFEGELAVVIGRRAHGVPEVRALDHVAGYTCFNDGSVRDYQRRSSQWTVGKNFDATGGFGPELVTPDELPPGAHGLAIRTRVNGRLLQDGNTGDLIFPVARLIALLSEVMTLEPGDVIATGTPSGVGYARTPPVWLVPGDVCEVEIEGIGVLRNSVTDCALAADAA